MPDDPAATVLDRTDDPMPDTVQLRRWCIEQALSRNDDDDQAIRLASKMIGLLELGPPALRSVEMGIGPAAPLSIALYDETDKVLDRINRALGPSLGQPVEPAGDSTEEGLGQGETCLAHSKDPEPTDSDVDTPDPPDASSAEVAQAAPDPTPGPRPKVAADLTRSLHDVLETMVALADEGVRLTPKAIKERAGENSWSVPVALRGLRDLGYVEAKGATSTRRYRVLRRPDGTEYTTAPAAAETEPEPEPGPARLPSRRKNPHIVGIDGQRLRAGGEPGERLCLKCRNNFDSAGPGDRVCPRCEVLNSRQADIDPADSPV